MMQDKRMCLLVKHDHFLVEISLFTRNQSINAYELHDVHVQALGIRLRVHAEEILQVLYRSWCNIEKCVLILTVEVG